MSTGRPNRRGEDSQTGGEDSQTERHAHTHREIRQHGRHKKGRDGQSLVGLVQMTLKTQDLQETRREDERRFEQGSLVPGQTRQGSQNNRGQE